MNITKETLHLLDAILERLRDNVLSTLMLNANEDVFDNVPKAEDVEAAIDERLDEYAVHEVAYALGIALRAGGDSDELARQLMMQATCYFEDDEGEVRMVDYLDLEVAWRPMPPGPATKIFYEEPEGQIP